MNIFRRFLSTSIENANYKVAPRLFNRNPRTLESQNLQWRSSGWPLQYPPRDYIHRALLRSTNRHLIAEIDHYYTGKVCVQASTYEWGIRKHLATCKDRTVAYNLGLILGQRAEECGISKIYFGHPRDNIYEQSARIQNFYRGLVDSNVEFEEPNIISTKQTRDDIDGINYDDHQRDVRYSPPPIPYPPEVYQEKLYFFQLGLNEKLKNASDKQDDNAS